MRMLKLLTAQRGSVQGAPDFTAPLPTSAFPEDWPAPGPVDLDIHDLPHASAALEWWYVNAHLETATGRHLGIFAAFFRQAWPSKWPDRCEHVHSITWALTDEDRKQYYPRCAVDRLAPALGLSRLENGGGVEDDRINRAMREVFARGHVPEPTRMFERDPAVALANLSLDYDGQRFFKHPNGTYELHLHDPELELGCDLVFSPSKPPTRHGDNGVVHGVADELMFYYFIPRCSVSGTVVLDGEQCNLSESSGWYDHEFGFVPNPPPSGPRASSPDRRPAPTLWTWAALQLDEGVDLTLYSIAHAESAELLDHWVILSGAHGSRRQYRAASFTPLLQWQSPRTFIEYPVAWSLEVPEAGLSLRIEATFPEQEVMTVISDPAFWEGQVKAAGTFGGRPTSGRGWVERKGFRFHRLDEFLKAAGKVVRQEVAKVLPLKPSAQEACRLLLRHGTVDDLDGLDGPDLAHALFEPVREMVERGGKAWRSYAALGCIDVLGGDTSKYLHWLAIPEILHVGSLLVDDVEDRSRVRRGGATSHLLYGEPLAINAGTAAYFMAEPPVENSGLSAETKLRIYHLYFDVMRAGHAGQALDLAGMDNLLSIAVESGNMAPLERRVLTIHRLKTAIPAGLAARVGAILGGGTNAQIEALGSYFEAVGLAFQIVDDVLNLRGFQNDLKQRGEDLLCGKITLPVVIGLGRVDDRERAFMAATLRSHPDAETAEKMTARLEDLGALDACEGQARDLVEAAWTKLDPLLVDSQQKVLFRAFGWYVLERHY
jgi:geranylgeranyl pyrophosphate synthase/predicted secreted hydrolase